MKPILLVMVLLASANAAAQAPGDVAAARERISAARSQAEAEFKVQEKACYQRFAVNDCLQAARTQRRTGLAELRREEIALNDAERQRKAAERLKSQEERAAERAQSQDASRPAEAAARQQEREAAAAQKQAARPPAPESPPAVPQAPVPRRESSVDGRSAPSPAATVVRPPTDTSAQVLKYQKRLEEAQARKERAASRLAERDKPAAAPLPTP
jgi:colicin import membrane protein